MTMPMPPVPDTGKVRDGYLRMTEERNQINQVFTGPTEPPHALNRVWIRPSSGS
jgi:hypothetical protein